VARPQHDADDLPDEDDDAALRWEGDEERGLESPRRRAARSTGSADPEDLDGESQDDAEEPPAAPGERGRRVAAALFAVAYLAEVVGWVFGTALLSSGAGNLWSEVLWQFGEFLAIVSPALWYLTVLTLTRASRPLVRVGWFALGLGVLVPWPAALELAGAMP
jgi:hypothetical protein